MAGYECSLCSGQEQAVLLITPLTGGETMAVGPDCMAVGLAGMLAGHLGIDADKLWDAAQRLLTKQLAAAAKQASEGQAAEQESRPQFPEGPSGSSSDDLAAIEAAAAADGRDSGKPITGTEDASTSGEGISVDPLSGPQSHAEVSPAKGGPGDSARLPGRPPRHAGRSS